MQYKQSQWDIVSIHIVRRREKGGGEEALLKESMFALEEEGIGSPTSST